ALTADASVDFAVTVGHTGTAGVTMLVSYVVGVPGRPIEVAELSEALGRRLPSYMVPSSIIVIDRIPLTPTGKLDRRALPAPVFEVRQFRAPSTPIEEIVAQVFGEVLDVERVGADDDFFTLGGNSLIATQVASRLGNALETRVPVRMLFEAPTVAALAARVESHVGAGGRRALVARERPDRVPLSLAQQRMWFLNRFSVGSADAAEAAVNNIPVAIRLSGALDVAALRAALLDVIDRHESLRTRYPESDGQPYQEVMPFGRDLLELSPTSITESELPQQLTELVLSRFDVTAEVPLRVRLFEISPTEHVLALVAHHISADGFSMGPLTRDVMIAYTTRAGGAEPDWQPLAVQYADYALWQREVLGSEDDPESLISSQIRYWTEQLAELTDELPLPSDRPRPPVASYRGGTYPFTISAETQRGLVEIGRKHNASLFMVMHSALAILLARMSGTDDIAIGTPVAGRGEAALDDLVGMFVNTLVLRTEVRGAATIADLLADVRDTDLHAFAHADVPFERLVEVLNPTRSQARHPLFQVMLSFQNLQQTSLELPGLAVRGVEYETGLAKFDLQLMVQESVDATGAPAGMSAAFAYSADLFDEATVADFARRLDRVLAALAADADTAIGDIDLLGAEERSLVLRRWNATEYTIDPATLVSLFEAQVERTPDAVALTFEGTSLSYAEFASRVSQLARWLTASGVGPESLVALGMRRSVELVVGMYAVSAAGGAYVPIDPDHPAERIAHILDTAQPVCVLTTSGDALELPESVRRVELDTLELSEFSDAPVTDADRLAPLRPDNTAYVIYTSGSTGRPKGVAVSHAAIVNRLVWMHAQYGLTAGDVVLQKTPATFDVSVWEFFWPLQVGARLVVAKPDGHRDPAYLTQLIVDEGVTTVHFVPSMLAVFVADPRVGECVGLRHVFASGEALPAPTAQLLRESTGAALHNLYGPTEAAVDVTFHEVVDTDTVSVPIGLPVFNTQVYVLDARLHPVAPGVPGELYLAGAQLARGYVRQANLTADRFVANPFADGERMYRTGDLVRWTRSARGVAAELEYLGRTDFQVKVRGLRIELGEIESALTAQDSVAQAVVVVREDERTGAQLVAYLVAAEAGIDLDALRLALTEHLPGYMVPAAFVVLAEFPLNASGKLDRKALPQPTFEVRGFRAPVTPVQEIVAGVFADLLGVDRVGLDDDFFALGGNSLIATRATARLGAALDAEVPVRVLFDASTVEALAARVESHTGQGARSRLVARPRPAGELVPLSFAQQRMWFLNQYDKSSSAYNLPLAIRLSGELDTAALESALFDVVRRHESLRTRYPEHGGTPVQVVVPAEQLAMELRGYPIAEDELVAAVTEFVAAGFDVAERVPLRARLFQVRADEHVLVVVVHHIAADGFSMSPLARDVMTAYLARTQGSAPEWTPLPVQYADFAVWQREVLGTEDDPESLLSRQVAHWQRALADSPEELTLPTDRPRPAVASYRGATVTTTLPAELVTALEGVARAQNASLFMVTHAALAVLLGRLAGADDVTVGTPVAGRGVAALDDLVGMFVNTLVLRTRLELSESFSTLLAQARHSDLEAFGHADVPFERLVELLAPERSQARNPLFQVMLAFQNLDRTTLELPGLAVSELAVETSTARFDLQFTLSEIPAAADSAAAFRSDGMAVTLTYATDLFDEASAAAILRQWSRVLAAVAADTDVAIGDIPLLDAAETARELWGWNETWRELGPGATLVDLFADQVARTPDAVAVVDPETGQVLTYADFASRVHRLAHRLVEAGVGPETLVAVGIPRSLDLLIAIYAIVESGGGYVPLDLEQPADRIAYVLDAADPVCVLVTAAVGADLAPGRAALVVDALELSSYPDTPLTDADRRAPLRPAQPAYAIFTSGSTGRPKGVLVPHSAVVNQIRWITGEYGIDTEDAVLFKTPVTFDVSVWELFGPLSVGGRVVVAAPDGHRDPQYLAMVIAEHGVTMTSFVPSMLAVFAGAVEGAALSSLRAVLVAGEAFTSDIAAAFRRVSSARMFNLYGPTEFTVHATHAPAGTAAGAVPIGKPVWNAQAYVLDARFNPVPVGVAGELYLAGDQLARGYLGRPDLTADRFVAAPFGDDGARMYRTGDLVRRGPDGSITYLGRTDFQVKLRGMRIELGEIESALTAHESVAQAVVVVSAKASTDQLVGYVVPATQPGGAPATVDPAALRTYLAGRLQSHMVPAVLMVLPELPLNANGKLDRRALPEPVFSTEVAFQAPRNPVEHLIAELFAEVLGVERVGVEDSFFALGGDSIVSIQLVSRAKARGVVFSARDVFEQRTVAGLAVVAETTAAQGDSAPVLAELPGGGVGARPLTPVERFMAERPGSFRRFHQAVALALPAGIDRAGIAATIDAVLDRHDMLRARLTRDAEGQYRVETAAPGAIEVDALIDRTGFDAGASAAEVVDIASAAMDASLDRLDPEAGVVIRFVWLEPDAPAGDSAPDRVGYLIVVAHHLVVDGVSWRILVPDFVATWGQLTAGQTPRLEAPVTSMRTWAHALEQAAAGRGTELEFWRGVVDGPDSLLSARPFDPAVDVTEVVETIRVEVSAEVTQSLLTTVPALFHGGVNDGLLTALALAVTSWRAQRGIREDSALIRLEGHGREEAVVPGADLSRTVGWFTAIFPVRFDLAGIDIDAALAGGPEMGRAIKAVKEQLLAVPDRGVGYGLLRYLNAETAAALPDQMPGQISFNYLGRFAEGTAPEAARGFGWLPAPELAGLSGVADADLPAMAPLDINAGVSDDRLSARIAYPATLFDAGPVREFAGLWVRALEAVARHADTVEAGGHTPSDFPLVRSTQSDIDEWERRFPALTDVWSLSPLQSGLLFHAQLAATSVDVYTSQAVLTLTGRVSADRLRSAAQALVDRYDNLRTAFVTDADGNAVQLVLDGVEVAWDEQDRRATGDASDLIEADRMRRFDLTAPPLIRFTLIQVGEHEWSLAVTNHHILLDGWSMPLLMRDLLVLYATHADTAGLPPVRSYRYFLDWVSQQDKAASLAAWSRALQGFSEPTLLARPQVGREITALSGEYRFELDETVTAGITALAAELSVTVNTVLQAAWGLVLGRSTGSDDVLFGTTVSGRPAQLNGVENMVGLFINTVPVRVAFDPVESARTLLTRIQGEQADLLDHHYVGLTDIQSAAGLGGLFDTLMVFESYPVDAEGIRAQAADIDGMAVAGLDVADATHYPLTLIARLDSRLRIRASYLSDLLDADSVARVSDRLVRVLTALVAAPTAPVGDIELLGETERSNVLERWVSSGKDGGTGLFAAATTHLSTLVDAAVTAHGDRVAVRFGEDALTYAELDQRANQLARKLIAKGAGPGQLVAVILPRSLDLVVALLAVVKSGAGYVPIDPAYPADRIAYVLSDAAPASVIVDGSVDAELLDGVTVVSMAGFGVETGDLVDAGEGPITDADRLAPLRASNTAYVIYTSGSTGRPKGVAVAHRNVVRLFANTDREFGFGPDDVWTLFHSSAFDFSVWELWGALLYGGTVVVVDYFVSRSPEQFLELLRRERVTVLNQTPSAFYQLADADRTTGASEPLALRYVVFGGEALDLRRLADWMARRGDGSAGAAGPRLVNMYGITETTVHVTHRMLDAETVATATGSVIGRAIAGLSVYVLDTRLNPVPVGVPGEMYVAGPQLADGYLGRADLTTARFVANPFGAPGSRLYRSGDLARWNEQGELEHLGRADDQVKVRGFRIELGEIEAALLALDEVAQAAVVVRSDGRVSDQLVGYVVPVDGDVDTESLRTRLSETLPAYMVPSVLMVLAALPLTVNGKLDRRALPAPVLEAAAFRAPVTAAEQIVAGVFAEVLGVDRVGLDDDFFALGGNSLIATRVAARLSAALDSHIGVREIFEASTVAALAARAGSGIGTGARQALVPQQRPETVPLSLAQQRMWFLNRFDPESAVDNIPLAVRLSGLLDRQALQIAVADVLARHESLRTRYPEVDGTARQEIVPTAKVIPDLSPVEVAESELPQHLSEFVLRGFDVTAEVPLRARLFEISPTEHVLVLVAHHISADGFSMGPLARDVMTAYAARVEGGEPTWTPLAVQYADFALWQRAVLGAEDDPESVIAQQISYWRQALAGLPDQLDLPSDRPRPAIASGRGARLRFEIDPAVQAGLTELAQAQGATLFMVVHTALAVLLARLSGESDIAIGTPVAGRGERALDDLVGMFVNTLVLRTEVDGGTGFNELLQTVRATDIAAFGHADLPFERLVEILSPARSQARNPLFQVMLALQNTGQTALELPELTVSAVELPGETAKFDLQLVLAEEPGDARGGIKAEFIYATDLFDAETIADFARRFTRILKAITATPDRPVGDLPLLDVTEHALLLRDWNATHLPIEVPAGDAAGTLIALFEAQVAATPEATAITFEGTSLSYAEFAGRVRQLSRWLIERGVGAESLVALGMRRSIDLVIGMYAAVAAGGGYVPLDPDHPAERTAYVLDTADPVCVLTSGDDLPIDTAQVRIDLLDLSGYSDDPVTDAERRMPLRPANTAYVIFTSGSTGRPKGVAVSHAAIVNRLIWMQAEYGLTAADVVLQKTPATFDVSVWEFFWPLQIGARLVVARPDGHRDPAYLAEVIETEQVTTAHFVPAMMSVFVAELEAARSELADGAGDRGASLRQVFASGEALPAATAQQLRALTGARLHNLYGPTEAAVDVTYHEVTDADTISVPIGAPVANTQVYVLDARLHSTPIGVAGELYLAGAQLARGYVERADLSAERFVANPFSSGERMYRTGDLVRWTNAGELEYLGRTDFQVKLRGLRIELGEIEAALTALEPVAQAVVVVRSDDRFGDQLVGYLIASAGQVIDIDDMRADLARSLPAYMVPSAFVILTEFPLNASGKLDRKALPAPVLAARVYRRPVTPIEVIVAGTFAEVLGIDEDGTEVGLDDDFFELGGNSLIATQVIARLGAALDTRIPVRMLFEASTVGALAARLSTHVGTGGRGALVAGPRPEQIPLSLAQQRMWFLNRFDMASAVNNLPLAIRLTGDLDVLALQQAVRDVIARHEVLRTYYPETADGQGVQVILPVAEATPALEPVTVTEAELHDRIAEVVLTGFDVTSAVPVRAELLRVTPTEHVLVVVVHHISGDGWSMRPLAQDVMVAYVARSHGEVPGWAPLPVQYADYALWQRETLGSEDDPESLIAEQTAYWTTTLAGLPGRIDLPTDRPRPVAASNRGAVHPFSVDEALQQQLTELGRTHGASMFMVVHAALAVLVGRLSGSGDIAIGTPVAGRGEAELDNLIGMFVNTLVLRTELDPSVPFSALLAQTKDTDLAAFAHADVPFERLVEVLSPERSQAHHPLFQVALSFEASGAGGPTRLTLPGLEIAAVDFDPGTAKFDLQLAVADPADGGLAMSWNYATDLFDAATIAMLSERLLWILRRVATDPDIVVGDIDLLGPAERADVTRHWVSSGIDGGTGLFADRGVTLPDLVDAMVAAHGDRVAARFGDDALTYAELDRRANRLARALIAQGAGPGRLVAVLLPRSLDLVVALLAVVKSGAGYVPVDPTYPADRIAYVLEDSAPAGVIVDGDVEVELPDDVTVVSMTGFDTEAGDAGADPVTDADRIAPLRASNTAYVIYTSGSTGRPKGVVVAHRNVVRLFANTDREFGFGPDDVWTLFHSSAFDFSVWELWGALVYGGTVVVVDYFVSRSPEQFLELLRRERVTVLNQTPSAFYQLAEVERTAGTVPPLALRYVVFGGEALDLRRLGDWMARHGDGTGESAGPRLVNMYGITETTVHVTHRVLDAETVAAATGSVIGRAIAGLSVYVLDTRLNPVPVGVPGEMYVAGPQLTDGYLGRADLSAARFVANPFGGPGERLYRSGDLARWNAQGELEHLGRADDQVKVRGFRIELGEIEAALLALDEVAQAAVVVRSDGRVSDQLVGYVVPVDGDVDTESLRTRLSETLPAYMVPSVLMVLAALPLTVNGKLDRRALPAPVLEAAAFRAPVTPVEEIVADVFAEVLGVDRVGLDDDFFALGGNSLIATRVNARLGAALDRQLSVRDLFEASSVAALAARLEENGSAGRARPPLVAGPRPERIPLSSAQRRYWFLNQFDPATSAVDNIPLAVRLSGTLDVAALELAIGDLLARHEVLRTVYPQSAEGPHQVILPVGATPTRLTPVQVSEDELIGKVIEFALTAFDVTVEVPLAMALFQIAPDEHVLAFTVHHVSADGFSLAPLARDVMTAYVARVQGDAPQWLPLPVQYADYALWQHTVLGAEDDPESLGAKQVAYWQAALADLPDRLELPTDRPRPPAQSFHGKAIRFEISPERHARLLELARAHNASLFMVVHAALAVLLSRLSGTDDIAVGTPIAGRGERELDDMIGMFVNTLVFRTRVAPGDRFVDLLADVKERDLEAFANADVPFERLVEVLNPVRSTAHNPLFQVGFSFQNLADTAFELPGLSVSAVNFDSQLAKTDLHVTMVDHYAEDGTAAELVAEIGYAVDLFDESTVQSFADRFVRVLDAVMADGTVRVGEIEMLDAAESDRILRVWNDTGHEVDPAATLVSLLDATVAAYPKSDAIVADGPGESRQVLTYAELDVRVNRLARWLVGRGV
ncbi:non-ribosomal peptide synthase/polyketide synthase, partial [Nocardia goodfellowii]